MVEEGKELNELCYILHRRNLIEKRRNSARYKVSYYQKVKLNVEAHLGGNSALRALKWRCSHLENTPMNAPYIQPIKQNIEVVQDELAARKLRVARPTKWIEKGVAAVNSMILKYKAEYAKAKYDASMHTSKYRKRVSHLLRECEFRLRYDQGSVTAVLERYMDTDEWVVCFGSKEIEQRHNEYLAQKAIEKMLTK